jgi:Zn-dependent protease
MYEYFHQPKKFKLGNITFSEIELQHLFRAWLAISFAFAILLGGLSLSTNFFIRFTIALLTVGLGFLLHELAHKVAAQHYRCWAEFRANDQMLMLAILMSFFGFLFAAPGAVMIHGHINLKQRGIISAAGPIINYLLAIIFLLLMFIYPHPMLASLFMYGFMINAFLGLFNMIPFGMFDGAKILAWDKTIFGVMVGVGIILISIQTILASL